LASSLGFLNTGYNFRERQDWTLARGGDKLHPDAFLLREFVRQQLIEFEQRVDQVIYMIHDHAAQFNINYIEYGMKSIITSVEAPNMNDIAERFVGSVRQEVQKLPILGGLHHYYIRSAA
jgi:hypothetical protein